MVLKDYQSREEKNVITGKVAPINLPQANVLQFVTENGGIISARPSGTEPKIKFYCSVNTHLESPYQYHEVDAKLDAQIDTILKDLGM